MMGMARKVDIGATDSAHERFAFESGIAVEAFGSQPEHLSVRTPRKNGERIDRMESCM